CLSWLAVAKMYCFGRASVRPCRRQSRIALLCSGSELTSPRLHTRKSLTQCAWPAFKALIYPLSSVLLNIRRSEEHTSELQSRENLVCRLLLEKKKANLPLGCH